jgi:hypothetical protein
MNPCRLGPELLRADTVYDLYTRLKLREIAARYARLTQRIEQQVGGTGEFAIQARVS